VSPRSAAVAVGHHKLRQMIWVIFIVICAGAFALDRGLKRCFPEFHKSFARVTWAIEILLLLMFAAGVLYLLVTGHAF
jgi:hypothetical protein